MAKRGPKPKRSPVGAPTKLSEKMIEDLEFILRSGCYVETAAAYVGIAKDTYYRWLRRGAAERKHIEAGGKPRKREALYAQLSDAIESAVAAAEVNDLALISTASKDSWQAAAWKLERRHPDRWGRRRHEITGADGGPIAVTSWADLVASAAKSEGEDGDG